MVAKEGGFCLARRLLCSKEKKVSPDVVTTPSGDGENGKRDESSRYVSGGGQVSQEGQYGTPELWEL